jgi:L-arabinonolactonase
MRIDVLIDVKPLLGEGPLWDPDTQRLYFIDSLGKRVFRCTEHGAEVASWLVPESIGSMCLRKSGGAIVSLQSGFHTLDLQTGDVALVAAPEPGLPNNRLNDGKVDAAGRFIAGSMDMGESAATGSLWSLLPDFSLRKLDDGIIVSNGPCWSPDNKTLYFADSFSGAISAYDYNLADGSVGNKRIFTKVDASRGGAPDGATVDAEGFVWSAGVFDGRIFRYAPDGSVERVIEMPVVKITSVAFGGPELDTLFVTSMAEKPLPHHPDDGPLRGSVFRIRDLGVRGRPEPKFGG